MSTPVYPIMIVLNQFKIDVRQLDYVSIRLGGVEQPGPSGNI